MNIQLVMRTLAMTLLAIAAPAGAGPVLFESSQLLDDRWQYAYTIDNDTGSAIEGLTVYFDIDRYLNLEITGNANEGTIDAWDGFSAQPDPQLPDDGFADWLALGLPLDNGKVLGGFTVAFNWLGAGLPGNQFFELYRLEPGNFDFDEVVVIEGGFTTPLHASPPPAAVPIPGSLALLLAGMGALTLRRGRGPSGRRGLTRRAPLGALLFMLALTLPTDQATAATESLMTGERELISRERRGRSFFDYTYRIEIINPGAALTGVVASVVSSAPSTLILDGEVIVGDLAPGSSVPADTFTIRQDRRVPFDPDDLVWTFVADPPPPVGDNAPEIISSPQTSGVAGGPYRYQVVARDADAGDELTYRLALAPPEMTIDPAGGEITWAPSQARTVDVDVRVSDSTGLEDRQIYLLRVTGGDGDQPPELAPIADQRVAVGESFEVLARGVDPEGGGVSYRITRGPRGLAIGSRSGQLRFTATGDSLGANAAEVTVTDPGGLSASRTFSIRVSDIEENSPPSIDPVPDLEIPVGDSLLYTFGAADPDPGDILSFELQDLPAGAQFDPRGRRLSWTPTATDVGLSRLTLRVADSAGETAATSFTIAVTAPPQPPVARDDAYTVGIRDRLDIDAPGVLANDSDPNGDALAAFQTTSPVIGELERFGDDGSFSYLPPPLPDIDIGLVEKCQTEARFSSGTVSVADVDNDGVVELVGLTSGGVNGLLTAVMVVDGRTCATESSAVVNPTSVGAASASNTDTLVNLDDDPELEVVGVYYRFNTGIGGPSGFDERLYALNLDGTPLENWPASGLSEANSFDTALNSGYLRASPVAVDLNGDGTPELIIGYTQVSGGTTVANTTRNAVVAYDGRTGTILWEYVGGITRPIDRAATPTLVDLDLDGDTEIIWNQLVLDHTGTLLFELPVAQTIPNGGNDFLTVAVANFDDDPFPEIIGIDASNITLYSHTGSVQWQKTRRSGGFNYPWSDITVAELDGDPQPEFVAMLVNDGGVDLSLYAFDSDGTQLWEQASLGFIVSGFTEDRTSSPLAFDFDRDGIDELVQMKGPIRGTLHPEGLYIINGETGTIIAFRPGVAQTHGDETLTVADVDGDGSAEILTNFGQGRASVQVWDSLPDNPFPPAPRIRSGSSSQPTWVNEDGSLPRRIEPHWLIPGLNKVNAAVVVPDPATDETDSFAYLASDGVLDSAAATVRITLAAANAPRIISTPPPAGSPGFAYEYGVLATDADAGDALSYTLLSGPAGMSIDRFGRLLWTPDVGQSGSNSVEVLVTDSQGNAHRQRFNIDVRPSTFVPDLAGLEEAAARNALEGAGLTVGDVSETFSLTADAGTVATQSIAADSEVAAGTALDFRLSLGPQPIFVPELVDIPLAAAEDRLGSLALVPGVVTYINSDSVPRGSVVTQSAAAGFEVPPGTAVDLTVSGGPALQFRIGANLISGGDSAAVVLAAFDSTGAPALLPGDLSLSVIPDADATGTPPTFTATGLTTDAGTRGAYLLRAESSALGTAVEEELVVEPAFAASGLQAAYGILSAQLNEIDVAVLDLAEGLRLNDPGRIADAGARLRTLRDALDLEELRLTPAANPDDGFLPQSLPGSPNSADAGFARRMELAMAAVRESQEFLESLRPGAARDDDLRAVFINSRLDVAARTLVAQSATTRGLVAQAGPLYELLSVRLPGLVARDLDLIISQLEDAGLISMRLDPAEYFGNAQWASAGAEDWLDAQPTFFSLAGIVSASGIRNKIIKDLYLGIVKKVVKLSQNLVAEGLVRRFTDSTSIPGIVTGASQSFHAFESGHSIIEAFSAADFPDGHVVQLIGPSLVSDIASAVSGVAGVRFNSRKAVKESVKRVRSAAEGATAAPRAQFKQTTPDQLLNGCVFSTVPGCQQLGFSQGLPVVHTDGGFPAPVLLIVHDVVGGNVSVGSFLFYPN